MYIFNNTQSSGVWVGQSIAAQSYFFVEVPKRPLWGYNDAVLADILSSNLIVSTTNDSTGYITSSSLAVSMLRGEPPSDVDGAPLTRVKVAPAGWHYQLRGVDVSTSTLGGIFTMLEDGTSTCPAITPYFKDAAGNLLTDQGVLDTDCVETGFFFEPTWDYEMIGGSLYQENAPAESMFLNVIAVPDIPAQYGGSVVFARSVNVKRVAQSGSVSMDGRVSKRLTYDANYHTNKVKVSVRHPAGFKHSFMIVFELFKAPGGTA